MHPRCSISILIISLPLLAACGPTRAPVDASGSATGTGTSAGPPDPTTLSTSTTAPPTTGGLTGDIPLGGTSSSTSTGMAAESSTGEGCQFICESDIPGPGCDNFAQDCPDGQKCVAYAEGGGGSWNALKCVDVTGDQQPGEPCTVVDSGVSGIDDCAKGVMCWNVDEQGHGVCVAQCGGSPEAPVCPKNEPCTIGQCAILALCLGGCDPLLQDCPGDDLCIPNGDSFVCVLDASGDEGQVNDTCEFANACDKGLVCLDTPTASAACDPASAGCCQPFCAFPDAPCPNPDQQCVQWYDPMMLPPNDPKLEIGACQIPP